MVRTLRKGLYNGWIDGWIDTSMDGPIVDARWMDGLTNDAMYIFRVVLEPRLSRRLPAFWSRSTTHVSLSISRPTRRFATRLLSLLPSVFATRLLVSPPIWWSAFLVDPFAVFPSSYRKKSVNARTTLFPSSLLSIPLLLRLILKPR